MRILIALILIPLTNWMFVGCEFKSTTVKNETQGGPVTFKLDSIEVIIRKKTNLFTESHITRDTAFLNSCFTYNARVFPPGTDAVIGKKAISILNADWVGYGISEFKEESTSFYGNDDFVVDEGVYFLRYGEENITDQGKYINIWTVEQGEWKLTSNIWNSSLSAESE